MTFTKLISCWLRLHSPFEFSTVMPAMAMPLRILRISGSSLAVPASE